MKRNATKQANGLPDYEVLVKRLNSMMHKMRSISGQNGEYLSKMAKGKAKKSDTAAYAARAAEFKRLSTAFNELIAVLPKMKFDTTTGKYMIGVGKNPGTELFVVRVTDSTSAVITVEAKSEKAAIRQAMQQAKAAGYSVGGRKPIRVVKAEVVSQDA